MKKIKVLALCAIVAGFVTSCQKEDVSNETEQEAVLTPTKDQLSKLHNMGVNTSNVTVEKITFPDGTSENFLVSGDITVPFSGLQKFEELEAVAGGQKQYRTNNLVSSSNRNISVIGYTGSGYALTSKMQTALQWAINNYNALNTSLNFTLSFGASTNADMVVYNNGASGGGGSAGFPSGGRAYKWIQINQGTNSSSTNVVEHVMTHEIGHCIGFRHQDWVSRQSCGQNSNEGQAGVGAVLIPGTPSSQFEDSIMLACFSSGEDGEFSNSDRVAINALY
ncbi:M57 family metalloprotease [Aquimarina aquimarini]|uniref:M57 family metalloprotease n=1 Tax=Aquimarina aquimarini TaxID=1191734 RepID=UPI000D556F6F|nr:M57 family metalloprotease [Aquimarina aquimarini]